MAEQQPSTEPERQMFLKWSIHHYKLPSVDDKEFSRWYQEEQIPRMIKIIQRHGVEHYDLYITPSSMRELFRQEIGEAKPGLSGWTLSQSDATSSYWVSDPEKLKAMLADPDWANVVVASEKGWIYIGRAEVQIGWENSYIEDGQVVNTTPVDS
ncbi:hypothetical protein F5X99DRAFT_424651 [Biscogniauxia marginata]|nr:hypothetical protein F5X99DRAFT_424651 [Biscogniauxia marginata]